MNTQELDSICQEIFRLDKLVKQDSEWNFGYSVDSPELDKRDKLMDVLYENDRELWIEVLNRL
jgi:hypothetical protein